MFVILQKYDFSSKSQHVVVSTRHLARCLWYCKSTIFQANHNISPVFTHNKWDVCDTAKVRFFKQITTQPKLQGGLCSMFVILQKYDFSSKSQLLVHLVYCKFDVCDTAKVRFFKQITTPTPLVSMPDGMFVILQKYDFSSKSQPP